MFSSVPFTLPDLSSTRVRRNYKLETESGNIVKSQEQCSPSQALLHDPDSGQGGWGGGLGRRQACWTSGSYSETK